MKFEMWAGWGAWEKERLKLWFVGFLWKRISGGRHKYLETSGRLGPAEAPRGPASWSQHHSSSQLLPPAAGRRAAQSRGTVHKARDGGRIAPVRSCHSEPLLASQMNEPRIGRYKERASGIPTKTLVHAFPISSQPGWPVSRIPPLVSFLWLELNKGLQSPHLSLRP